FLEILLMQTNKTNCKKFLNKYNGNLNITDFSLHSIGVILFRFNKEDIFRQFIEDVIPNIKLVSLPVELYEEVINTSNNLNLDFDDAYQYSIAKHYGLRIATMDKDFNRIKDLEILFL
ncbi:PIN domain-containing protein, partial [bacterium]|nr:PIN domain-containing protein [bacterium]